MVLSMIGSGVQGCYSNWQALFTLIRMVLGCYGYWCQISLLMLRWAWCTGLLWSPMLDITVDAEVSLVCWDYYDMDRRHQGDYRHRWQRVHVHCPTYPHRTAYTGHVGYTESWVSSCTGVVTLAPETDNKDTSDSCALYSLKWIIYWQVKWTRVRLR